MKNPLPTRMSLGAAALLAALAFPACALGISAAPYVLSDLAYTTDGSTGNFRFAGIAFSLFNATDKEISSIETSCLLYGEDKRPLALSGSNCLRATFDDGIAPQESKRMCIPLDGVLDSVPEGNIIIDFFTVPLVRFSDGTRWEDPLSAHFARNY